MTVPPVPPEVLLTAGDTVPDAAQARPLELDALVLSLRAHTQGLQNRDVLQRSGS